MSKNEAIKKAPSQDDYESVCGLDALYFYIKVDKIDYTDFYINHLLNHHIEGENFVLLSPDYKKQFTYFQHLGEIEKNKNNNSHEGFSPLQDICRIGFKNLNSKDNLESILIQMSSTALQQMNIDDIILYFTKLLNGFGLVPLKFQMSRVDLNTYVFDFPFNWLSYDYFSTKAKKVEPKYNGYELETFYLGSRNNGMFLRIYNKRKQLLTLPYNEALLKEHLIELKYLKKYLTIPEYKHLWNIEVELRREQLKLYKIDTLEDFNNKVNSLFKIIMTKTFRLLEEKKSMTQNDNRINTHTVWEHIISDYDYNDNLSVEIDKEKLKEYKRDAKWLKNRIEEFLQEPLNQDLSIRKEVNYLLEYLKQKGV